MGEFLERPNRFSVWVRLNGRPELAYLPNPGRLLGILTPGRPLLLQPAEGEVRKPRYTAVGTDLNGMLVSLDSTLPNRFFPHALAQGLIPPLAGPWREKSPAWAPAGPTDLAQTLGMNPQDISSLARLRTGMVLRRTEAGYELTDVVFARWLSRD